MHNGMSYFDSYQWSFIWFLLGQIGENIRFGSNDPTEIIINLLIDDGVEARGQRKNILNKEFKYIGAALAGHDVS